MAGTNRELVEQLLRRQRDLRKEFARYEASYARQMEAIQTLLTAEGVEDEADGPLTHLLPPGRRQREAVRNRDLHEQDVLRLRAVGEALQERKKQLEDDDSNTKSYVTAVLEAANGVPLRMADIVNFVIEMMGDRANEDTTRSVLQRLVHTGVATKTERGWYALAPKQPDEILVREHLRGIESATNAANLKVTKERDATN